MKKITSSIFQLFAQLGHFDNVEYVLRDREGKIKPIFQLNFLGKILVKHFGIQVPQTFPFGRFSNRMTLRNLITSAGKAGAASRLNGAGAEAAFTYIALGTGTNAAAIGDTALQTEIASGGGQRVSATASRVTTSVTNDTAQLTNTFSFTSSFAVTESGILNAASVGTLLARQVFAAINVANGDSLQITWKVQFS